MGTVKELGDEARSSKLIKYILIGILASLLLFILMTTIRAAFGYHVKIGPIEFNDQPALAKTDTVYIDPKKDSSAKVQPTIPPVTVLAPKTHHIPLNPYNPPTPKEKSQPSITQHIDSGGRGIQNNGINNGIQSNGDVYVAPRKFHQDERQFMDSLYVFEKKNGITSKDVALQIAQGSNAPEVREQLKVLLLRNGYNVNHMSTMLGYYKGIQISKSDENTLVIVVGMLEN